MKRIAIIAAAMIGSFGFAGQANAWLFHKHYCNCGDSTGAGMCTSTSSTSTTSGGTTTSTTSGGTTTSTTSGGTTTSTTSGGTTTSTTSTTSGGTTSSTTGGTDVPEPGMLGMMGLGFIGLAVARRRRR
ncbi:PEP-CTERM sorting domain-containing protein [Novosphingobium cyanobacteriorum]|uniref:PEP-CTERM sorting domain-containing protein n=1 Tax=Novosphingobium cyanobacteriorum TaxID=3024215 RepID=A0ABT6CQJ5_9SPHN|nr:PEP-CTERM sorting domain-containing protein [Novosphingobium cyanobacteriorum]MDF8335430.1 PEP-CTERM sorting domain-containing protein [Novosphingobium cyanobacteriorum]